MDGNSITPMDALDMFGVFRLAGIIWNLKHKEGMNIHTKMVTNKYGIKFGSYSLKKNEPQAYTPKKISDKNAKLQDEIDFWANLTNEPKDYVPKKISDKNAKLLDEMNPSGKWKEFISDYTADDKRHKNV